MFQRLELPENDLDKSLGEDPRLTIQHLRAVDGIAAINKDCPAM
jgi:hypothetical protein